MKTKEDIEYLKAVKEIGEILSPKSFAKLINKLTYLHMDRERIIKSRDKWKKEYLKLKLKLNSDKSQNE